jgi:tRNA (guanine37-N1)-methyltransferase
MNFHVVTLFPEAFDSYLQESIIGRAIKEKRIKVTFVNPRKFVTGKYKKVWPDGNKSLVVDDRPYGGGPGMIIRAEPVLKAVESIVKKIKNPKAKIKVVNFSPAGEKFTTSYAKTSVKKYTDIIMLCGRYEGIDSRVAKILKAQDISIGDYVLTGGELPAMILIDSISRQIPGVLGKFDSLEEERISSSEFYTRPEILEYKGKKYKVPPVLLSGDHKKIDEWKQKNK